MELSVLLSIFLPIVVGAFIIYLKSDKATTFLTWAMLPILIVLAFVVNSADKAMFIEMPKFTHLIMIIFDLGLLVYFLKLGIERKNKLVSILAIVQLILFIGVLFVIPESKTADIYVDSLTSMFYLLVAIVGVPIAIYSIKYMDYDEEGKHKFVGLVVLFLGVMNFAVSVNNIEWFFALFETTTLFSVLFIGFRGDKEAINNSTLALWMNQIGGVAILVALLLMIKDFGVYHFSDLASIDRETITMASLGFLSLAALVKGAQMPFHKWLLGAMVAPTPVSAILHSATMVKIAPYLILRIAPIIKGTLLAKLLILTTGFVFVAAAIFALTQDNFKKILAYSTISLLGLMMLAAAVATPTAVAVSIMLIIFHGFAKGFLFIEAGVLEKLFKAKYLSDMNRLLEKAPLTLMFIFFGFLNMTFVPFGSFVAKWLMIEEASDFLNMGSSVLLIALVAVGGVFLSVLYMKALGVTIKHHRFSKIKINPQPKTFLFVAFWYYLWLLALAIFIAPFTSEFIVSISNEITSKATPISADGLSLVFGESTLYFWQILGALVLLLIMHIAPIKANFKGVDKIHPYNCGEITAREAGTYDFNFISRYENSVSMVAATLFIFVVILGGNLL